MKKYAGHFEGIGVLDLEYMKTFKANCIKNIENVWFKGSSQSTERDILQLQIEKCVGENCKKEEEIQAFLQNMQLVIAMKDNIYNRENYNDGETVKPVSRLFFSDLQNDQIT